MLYVNLKVVEIWQINPRWLRWIVVYVADTSTSKINYKHRQPWKVTIPILELVAYLFPLVFTITSHDTIYSV